MVMVLYRKYKKMTKSINIPNNEGGAICNPGNARWLKLEAASAGVMINQ
jgi:hypothetical protein